MHDSGDRFALARSRLSSRHGAAPREMITVHRLGARRTDGLAQDIAYSVDTERSGGRFDNAPEVREPPLRVTHLFRREAGTVAYERSPHDQAQKLLPHQ